MAGLNDDVDSGIENTDIVDGGAVKQPSIAQNLDKSITVAAQTNELPIKTEDVPTPAEIEALSNLDVNFKVVTEKQTKIVNMKDVEDEIIGDPSGIDKDGAEYAATVFESLLTGDVNIGHYTQFKSRVSMDHTKRVMRTAIARESANASLIFKSFVDQSMEDAKNLLGQLDSNYLPRLRGTIISISSYTQGMLETLKQNQNVVFPYKGGFVNMLTQDLASIDWHEVQNLQGDAKMLEKFRLALVEVQKSAAGAYIYAVLNGCGFDAIGDDEVRVAARTMPISIQDILAFYASPSAADLLQDAGTRAMQALDQVESFQDSAKSQIEEGKIDWEKGEVLSGDVSSVVRDLARMMEIVVQLAVFNYVSSELVEMYKRM
jgi:hypothetical protein